MGNNEKNNAKNNGNNEKIQEVTTSGCGAGRQATALRARRCQPDRVCSQDLSLSLGAIPSFLFPQSQQSANARNDEITSLAATLHA
jgi:hypothetical protein